MMKNSQNYKVCFKYSETELNYINNINETLGRDLIPIIKAIPGGVILVFPGYDKMEKCYDLW